MKTLRSIFISEANATLSLISLGYFKKYSVSVTVKGDIDFGYTIASHVFESKAEALYKRFSIQDRQAFQQGVADELSGRIEQTQKTLRRYLKDERYHFGAEPKDIQQFKVYAWERKVLKDKFLGERDVLSLTSEKAAALVEQVSNDFGFPKPELFSDLEEEDKALLRRAIGMKKNETLNGLYLKQPNALFLMNGGRYVLLHELGHAYESFASENGLYQAHGPLFVRIVAQLYAKYLDVDIEVLYNAAREDSLIPQTCTLEEFMKPVGMAYSDRSIRETTIFGLKYDAHSQPR